MSIRVATHELTPSTDHDTLIPTISGSRPDQDTTVFMMEVEFQGASWLASRNFEEFETLHQCLDSERADPHPPALPRHVLFGSNSESVVDSRIPVLQQFARFIALHFHHKPQVQLFFRMDLFERIRAQQIISPRDTQRSSPRRSSRRGTRALLRSRISTTHESEDDYRSRMLALAAQKLEEAEAKQAAEMANPIATMDAVAPAEDCEFFSDDDEEIFTEAELFEDSSSPTTQDPLQLESALEADHVRVCQEFQQYKDGTKSRQALKKIYCNPNLPCDFLWLHVLLRAIVCNTAQNLVQSNNAVPVMVVAGSCPSKFAGMQAIMYTVQSDQMDFWWIKPQKGSNDQLLEHETLVLHDSGSHKNAAEGSKKVYAPLSNLFNDPGNSVYTIHDVRGAPRVCIHHPGRSTMFVCLVWQEKWTTNPFARTKYLSGKLVYQKDPLSSNFFSCGYYMAETLELSQHEERLQDGLLLLPESLKDMRNCSDLPS